MYIVCKPKLKVLKTVTIMHFHSLTAITVFSARKELWSRPLEYKTAKPVYFQEVWYNASGTVQAIW